MLKKLDGNLDRGIYFENYFTEGLTLYWTETDPEQGHQVKSQTFEHEDDLKYRLAEIEPDLRKWRLRPIKGSDDR